MEGPIRGIRFIHKAIVQEMDGLEAAAWELVTGTEDQLASIRSRLDFVEKVVHSHADGEDAAWFPALDQVAPFISRPYVLDHQNDQITFRDIGRLLSQLSAAGNDRERQELAQRLYRQIVALNATLRLHVWKEEEQLVPFTEEHFSPEAQGAIVSQAVQHAPPELRQEMLPWILRALDPEEQEEELRTIMGTMPPDAFRALIPPDQGRVAC
jgi:hemerythrin-like domain-containing protein